MRRVSWTLQLEVSKVSKPDIAVCNRNYHTATGNHINKLLRAAIAANALYIKFRNKMSCVVFLCVIYRRYTIFKFQVFTFDII